MAVQRTIKLLQALSARERDELRTDIIAGKRRTLSALFSALLAHAQHADAEPPKEQVFREVFGYEYTKQKDYLLRNEYRLLNARMYEVIVRSYALHEVSTSEQAHTVALLRGLVQRGLVQEFEQQATKAREKAVQEYDFLTAWHIGEMLLKHAMEQRITEQMLREAHAIVLRQWGDAQQWGAVEQERGRSRAYSLEKMLRTAHCAVEEHAEPARAENIVAQYYHHTGETFRREGEQSVDHARRAVECIMHIDSDIAAFHQEKARALNNLALAYSLHGQWSEARAAFEDAMTFSAAHGIEVNIGFVFNYSSTLMKLGEYAAVLAVEERERVRIAANPQLQRRFDSFRCYCYVFLRQPEKAFDALPPHMHQLPPMEERYFRYVYVVLPYLHGQPEEALRETLNYQQYFRRAETDTSTHIDRDLVKLFRKLFTTLANTPDKPAQSKLHLVQKKLGEFSATYPDFADYLPALWLRQEVQRLLGEE